MCVIFVAENVRPNTQMVEAGYEANPSGAGIAWREDGYVKWKKGLEIAAIADLVKTLPMPFVVHFRIPSVGGPSKKLTHPFPLTNDVELSFEGQTQGQVLFHNGTWTDWKRFSLETAVSLDKDRKKIPAGLWSDSRALAWNANIYGPGILELIDEKVILFGPEGDIQIFGNDWSEEEGITVSNRGWCSLYQRTKNFHSPRPLTQIKGPMKVNEESKESSTKTGQFGKSGGTSQDTTFRTIGGSKEIQPTGRSSGQDQQKCSEEIQRGIQEGSKESTQSSGPIICVRETIGYNGPETSARSKSRDGDNPLEVRHILRGDVSSEEMSVWVKGLNPKTFHTHSVTPFNERQERQRRLNAYRKQGIVHQGRL